MKKAIFWLSWMLALALVPLACAPVAAPAPSPAPAPPVAPAAPAPQAAPALTPEEAAWAKVVEAARKEGSLSLYTNTFVGDAGLALRRALKERYGIALDIILGRGAEFVERLKTEKRIGQMVGDVVEGSSSHVGNAKFFGLLSNVSATLPAFRDKGVWAVLPQALDPEGVVLVYDQYPLAVYINTRLVPPGSEPKSWHDLLDPKWKGKIMVGDPQVSVLMYTMLLPVMESGALPPDFVNKLATQDLVLVAGVREGIERLARGENPIFAAGSPSHGATFAQEGAPIKAIDTREGVVINNHAMGAIKDSPHPNASRLFLNLVLSEEGQRFVAGIIQIDGIRKGLPSVLPPALAITPQNPVVQTNEVLEKATAMFREKAWVPLIKRK